MQSIACSIVRRCYLRVALSQGQASNEVRLGQARSGIT